MHKSKEWAEHGWGARGYLLYGVEVGRREGGEYTRHNLATVYVVFKKVQIKAYRRRRRSFCGQDWKQMH